MRGFTIIEFVIGMALMVVLIGAALPIYSNLQVSAQLNESSEELMHMMRLARARSVERYNNSSHGVYIEVNPAAPDRVVLYQGFSYASRDAGYDRVTALDAALSLAPTLSGGVVDITFSRTFGAPSTTGTIVITHSTAGNRALSLNGAGRVAYE